MVLSKDPDIVVLTETGNWELPNANEYFVCSDQTNSTVQIIAKKRRFRKMKLLEYGNSVVTVKLSFGRSRAIVVTGAYVSPTYRFKKKDSATVMEHVQRIKDTYLKIPYVVAGDLNSWRGKDSCGAETQMWSRLAFLNGGTRKFNTGPTRASPPYQLDHILTAGVETRQYSITRADRGLSDHALVHREITLHDEPKRRYRFPIDKRKLRDAILRSSANPRVGFFAEYNKAREKLKGQIRRKIPAESNLHRLGDLHADLTNLDLKLTNRIQSEILSGRMRNSGFKILKQITGFRYGKNVVVTELTDRSGAIVKDRKVVRETIAQWYEELHKARNTEEHTACTYHTEYMRLGVSPEEVARAAADVNRHKAITEELLDDGFLDEVTNRGEITQELTKILNNPTTASLQLLSTYLIGRLIPVSKVKDGSTPNVDQIRPIVALSRTSKIIENVLKPAFLKNQKANHDRAQVGFVPGMGTKNHLRRFSQSIKEHRARRKRIAALFIDLKSAYDSVPRQVLVRRLMTRVRSGGLPRAHVEWCKYLLRETTIQIGKRTFKTGTGVLQGGVLSPILFNEFLDDLLVRLQTILPRDRVLAYADDIVLLLNSNKEINECMDLIEQWCGANEIRLNYNKSGLLDFTANNRFEWSRNANRTHRGFPVVDEYRYLGVLVKRPFSFAGAIEVSKSKMNAACWAISQRNRGMNLLLKIVLWKTLALCHWDYILPILDACKKGEITTVEKHIRKTFRIATGLRYQSDHDPTYLLMNLQPGERKLETILKIDEENEAYIAGDNAPQTEAMKEEKIRKQIQAKAVSTLAFISNRNVVAYVNMIKCRCPVDGELICVQHVKEHHGLDKDINEVIAEIVNKLTDLHYVRDNTTKETVMREVRQICREFNDNVRHVLVSTRLTKRMYR